MSVEKQLGEISGFLKGMNKNIDDKFESQEKKLDNFRVDIKEVFGEIKKNTVIATANKTSIEGINKDLDDNIRPAIQSAQNKGMATGGTGIVGVVGLFIKSLFD